MDKVIIGVPIGLDYQADVRTVTIIESWACDGSSYSTYQATSSASEGRDRIVMVANQIIPRPTHILFIDSDVIPRQKTLKKLLSLNKDIVSGAVPICQDGKFKWNVSTEEKFTPIPVDPQASNWGLPNDQFKIESCGFGIVLVKTEVFDELEWPYWKDEYKQGYRTVGQDIYFCHKAREAGFDIWCDPMVKCSHSTRIDYLSIIRNLKKGATQ